MKLKMYLRGLGVGIIVTALLMHISNLDIKDKTQNEKPEIIETVLNTGSKENAEIVENTPAEVPVIVAKESGLAENVLDETILDESFIEENELDDTAIEDSTILENQSIEELDETTANEPETISEQGDKQDITNISEQEQMLDLISQVNEDTLNNSGEKKSNEVSDTVIEISIVKGDDSGTVSRKLYNVGLIDNPSEFDAYLMQHGYDKKISVGSVKIEPGLNWMQIAQKLAGH